MKPAIRSLTDALAPGSDERARVLVVDDDDRNLLAIQTVIEDIADVVVARSGEEALRHLLRGDFAVILLDVYMPGMDGYETAQIIRSREQTKRIPIVFLSAVNKETEHLMRGYSMGAVDYVFKPVEPVVIRSKVTVFVDLFTMRREIQRKAAQEQQLLDENLRANAERLRAEQELRLAEQRQNAIIASLPIILYLESLDDGPRVPRFVSGNFSGVTGYDFAELARTPDLWADRLHPEDRGRALAALAARKHGGTLSVEYRWRCADGEYKHFLDQAVLLRDAGGEPVEYAGTLLDVTDRRELENQLAHARKMDAIGQLTGGIAHDFNNLLAAILGGVGMIERRIPLDEKQARIVEMMRHAAEQGTELVRRLLAFARRQTLEPAAVPVDQLARAVSDLLAHTLGGLVQLEWDAAEDVGQVYADASQLELALMNLIINARDAMPDGGLITVSAENRAIADDGDLPAGRYVVLTVADTGCGIPAEMVEQVLEPFFTTKEVGKGTGLGLSMVYGFVKQSGGSMRIDSEVGRGTRVEIWLPMVGEAPMLAEEIVGPVDQAPQRPLRILLIDDHDGVRATTAALLEDLGHEVAQAECGASGLELLTARAGAFDLVVSDYAMPRQSGVDVLERARAVTPGLPGIIITGYADAQSVARRPDDVVILGKPFTSDQLAAAVRLAGAA
ncbi:response regulator [Sphingomonas lenta]|uniref:histidine kinase n=1 Tax=Sphingomonas lenta TaxID=1141887 RepID=A0A2A2SIH7_9SPHN|nr:response regulator [Sphingomonas lenta]PAX08821.1 hybrid sensor histidine kinase/response regulator [Sphingomonas lenta]